MNLIRYYIYLFTPYLSKLDFEILITCLGILCNVNLVNLIFYMSCMYTALMKHRFVFILGIVYVAVLQSIYYYYVNYFVRIVYFTILIIVMT